MSSAQPNSQEPSQLVRVQVVETVEQLNLRGPMTAEAFEIFASDNGRCELIEGKVNMISPAGFRSIMSTAQPNSPQSSQLVRAQVLETVEEVNARGPMTAEAFEIFAADNGRCELIEGKVNMMSPAGFRHGRVTWRIGQLLGKHVEDHNLGILVAAETGFLIRREPETVRAADIAFVSQARLEHIGDQTGFADGAPDLVIEVRSPSDRETEIIQKTDEWLAAGTKCVVNVDPDRRSVTVHLAGGQVHSFQHQQAFDAGPVIPNWNPMISDFFS